MAPFTFETTGRNRATLITMVLVWTALGAAWLMLDAAIWLVGILGLFTLPALYDLISSRRSGLVMDSSGISWFSGQRKGFVAWSQISHVRLDTRLDMSVRASLVLITGRKIRLPLETCPPAGVFETLLTDRGVMVERHHFSLAG